MSCSSHTHTHTPSLSTPSTTHPLEPHTNPIHSPFCGPPISITAFNIMVVGTRLSTTLIQWCYVCL